MSQEITSTEVIDKNYVKLAYIYQLLRNSSNRNKNVNFLKFKAIIDSDFDTNYKLPSDCLLSHNKPQYSGNTVSHFAVIFFNKFNDICYDYLIQRGINFTIKNDNGYTPFLLALIKSKCINRLLLFHLKKGNFTNTHCENGVSFFHAACLTGLIELVKCYLSAGACINESIKNDSPSFAGYTPLHFAMEYCQPQMIEFLLSNGACLNSKDSKGMTPLHLLVNKLMQRKTLEIDIEMQTFLQNAIDSNLFNLPDEIGFSYTHLSCILSTYKFQGVDANINTPLNLDSPIYPGYTPLHFATQFSFETVMSLLEAGADLLAKDINGTTPFDLCLMKFNLDNIIQILLKDKLHQLSELKFTNGIDVLKVLQAMKTDTVFNNYLQSKFKNINTFVPFQSPIWAGYSLVHLAIRLNVSVKAILAHQPNFNMQDANGISPLHMAFEMKNDVVSTILTNHFCSLYNSIDQNNLSDLHIACAGKNIEAVKHLLKYGANPNLPTLREFECNISKNRFLVINSGSTPFHIAIQVSCILNCNLVDILLSYGANPNVTDANGITPYHIALKYKQYKFFNQMLESDIQFGREEKHEKLGLTKLHIACIIRDLAMIKVELESGADVNKCINFDSPIWPGDTALHILCRDQYKSKKQFVKILLAYGANLNIQNASNSTPVHLRKGELLPIAKQSLQNDFYSKNPVNNEGLSHFHICCKANILFAVENFLKSGIDVNIPVDLFADLEAGYTPLHYAVETKNLKLIELLLMYGADPEAKAVDGSTPILLAKSRNIDINGNSVLLSCPAIDVQATNSSKENELEKILQPNPVDENRLNTLLDEGASMDYTQFIAEKPQQQKLIHRAICKLTVQNFKRLISNVQDLTYIDINGQNAIHYVCTAMFVDTLSYKFLNAVKALVDSGCMLNCKNNEGKTPLHLATSLRRIEMTKILLSLGADINVKDNDGKIPYEYIPENSEDLKFAFIYYIRKLEEAGLYVDESNNLYSINFDELSGPITVEKDKLNLALERRISPNFSTAYFFSDKFVNVYQDIPDDLRQRIDFFCNAYDLHHYFPHLYHMINLQFNRAQSKLKKNQLLISAAKKLQILTSLDSAEIRLEIVKYLDIDSIMNLVHTVYNK